MKPLLHNKKLSGLIHFFKTCYSVAVKIKKGLMFHMTEKTKRRSASTKVETDRPSH